MRDSFVGDIGDFSNNGLLRFLCGVTGPEMRKPPRLGVVWYYNNSDGPDGNHIDYLNVSDSNNKLYRECDCGLYCTLREMVGRSLVGGVERRIGQIKNGRILPNKTLHFSVPLKDSSRNKWLDQAIEKIKEADMIFINPDKGVALNLCLDKKKMKIVGLKEVTDSLEHVSLGELKAFANRPQSPKILIIYHHPSQGLGSHDCQIKCIAGLLKQELPATLKLWAIHWHRVSPRVYFILARTKEHSERIKERLEDLKRSRWVTKQHFSVLEF